MAIDTIKSTAVLDGAIATADIADANITTAKIADDAVTADKLANAINTDIATGVTGNTTANAALPKAGGTMTGDLVISGAKLNTTTSTAGFGGIIANTNGSNDANGLLIKSGSQASEYSLKVSNANDSTVFMVVKGDGNMGVGDSAPADKLVVSGNLKATSHYSIRGTVTLNAGANTTLSIPHGVYYLSLRHIVSGSTQHLQAYVTASWWHTSTSYTDVFKTGGDDVITASAVSGAAAGNMNLRITNGSSNSGHSINYSFIRVH